MEHTPHSTSGDAEGKTEQLSGKEKVKAILSLFGTDTAREAFIQNCRDYVEARDKAVHESYAPEVAVRRRAIISGPKQAEIHNRIMDTVNRLAAQAEQVSPLQRQILSEMWDRDVTAKIIREYITSRSVADEDDEDEGEKGRKGGMSDTAYYHSLGREH